MPEYKCETELKVKADPFIVILAKRGIKSSVLMLRDYMIRLSLEKEDIKSGFASIFYKASKNTFSIQTGDIATADVKQAVEFAWDVYNGKSENTNNIKYAEIKYYFDLLEKYKSNRISLAKFAEQLNGELKKNGMKEVDVESAQNDFNLLEKRYKELIGER